MASSGHKVCLYLTDSSPLTILFHIEPNSMASSDIVGFFPMNVWNSTICRWILQISSSSTWVALWGSFYRAHRFLRGWYKKYKLKIWFFKECTKHFLLQLLSINWAMKIPNTTRAIFWRCDWMRECEYYFTLPLPSSGDLRQTLNVFDGA